MVFGAAVPEYRMALKEAPGDAQTLGALAKAGQAMDRSRLEWAKSYYYSLMGWDAGTGVPTA